MALDADYLVDRRRLKRRLTLWRTVAIVVAVALVAAAVGRFRVGISGDYIARVNVEGIVRLDTKRLEAIDRLVDNGNVKAVVVRLNTPGGTVVGGETLYRAIKRVAAKKPVVAVMDDLATSAGYMIAVATDHIVARHGTITGSIGVLMQTAEITELLAKLGISVEAIKSGKFKAEPSPITKLTPEIRQATQLLVDDMQAMFISMVAEGRKMAPAAARALADGRIFTGQMALKNRLVDELGGEDEAIEWLEKERKIEPDLPVRDVRVRDEFQELFQQVSKAIQKTTLSERLTLDGLVSVWHPRLQ